MIAFLAGCVFGAVVTHISRAQYSAAGEWIKAQFVAWRARRAAAKASK